LSATRPKLLILGDFCVERLWKAVIETGVETRVVASGATPNREVPPNVTWIAADRSDLRSRTYVRRQIAAHAANVVLPKVRGTEDETILCNYAALAASARDGVHFHVHPPAFAQVATDKVAFHEFALTRSLPVPRGEVCRDAEEALAAARRLGGFSVLVKQAIAPAGIGVRHVRSGRDLIRACKASRAPFLVQKFLPGKELGVEIVSRRGRHWRFPVISMGRVNERLDPQGRLREAPAVLPAGVAAQLDGLVAAIADSLQPEGAWQLDLVLSRGRVYVLEINGRLGGLSNLSYFSTGVDPHVVDLLLALGEDVPPPRPVAKAVELPVARGTEVPELETSLRLDLRRARSQPNWRLSIGFRKPADASEVIRALPPGRVLCSSSDLDRALADADR
jgi:biotin carboxylase